MRRIVRNYFCTHRRFIDDKYQNISLETHNQLGSLHHVTQLLSDRGIKLKYIKSRTANAWSDLKKNGLDITIPKQTPNFII